ncbi:unnamed protein product [Cylindrotheca closterium]|uniref:Uncharacterized protein n=1 Tax=Cylindrotheca closterium TaxID=2856 RepID=A0AAD2G1F4_9STRA|nr:unnamed protein product [Cylindrotheca closterium]
MATSNASNEKTESSFLRSPHTWESLGKIEKDDDFYQALDFEHFNSAQQAAITGDSDDFVQLRAALDARTKHNGRDLHKRCFRAIQERVQMKERNGCFNFDLVNNFVHAEPIGCFTVSPCKGYIAIGTHCGGNYDGGGSIQIFEIATGQAVNQGYGGIEGGIGWSGHARMMQWIPEEDRKGIIAYCYHTNGFGYCYPTDEMEYPEIECFPLDGKDEPCPFTLSPTGTFAIGYGYNEEETVPGGTTDGDDELEYFDNEVPDHLKDEDGDAPGLGDWNYMMFANGGERLQGTTYNSAIAVDMDTRKLIYIAEGVRGESAWTQDGNLFAHSSPHLTIRNAATGEIIQEFPEYKGASELHWAVVYEEKTAEKANDSEDDEQVQQYRLAMVVGGQYDPNYSAKDEAVLGTLGNSVMEKLRKAKRARMEFKPPGVYVFDVSMEQQEFLCQLPTSTGFPTRNMFFADQNLWSWSPCGTMGAAMDKTAKVEIWHMPKGAKENDENPVFQKLSGFSVSESTLAIAFGKDSSVVTIGENVLEFSNAKDGSIIRTVDRAQFATAYAELSPVGASAMRVGDKDFGDEDAYNSFETNYSLLPILDKAGNAFNACSTKKGALLCPITMLEEAMKHCHFSFNNSHSWPLEWADFKTCESLRDLIDDPLFPLPKDMREKVRLAAETPTVMPQVKTLVNEDASVTASNLVESWLEMKEKDIESQGGGIIQDQLYDVCLVYINEGQIEKALDLATKIKPVFISRTSALCDAATMLLMKGQSEDAKPFVHEANSSLESFDVTKYTNLTFLYAPFMAMELALGDEEKARSFEAKAREDIDNENNPGEKYRCLARSFFLVERFTSAIGVLDEGRQKHLNYSRIIPIFLENKKVNNDVIVGLMNAVIMKATSADSGSFSSSQNIAMAISQCFAERGEHEKALELMKDHDKLFKSIRTVEAEIDVIRRLKEANEEAKAMAALDERIKQSRPYKSSLNSWLRALVVLELDSEYPADLLNELLAEMEKAIPAELNSRYTGPERFIEDLAWVEGRLGREDQFLAILKQSVNRQNFQLIAYLSLLNGSRSDNCRDIIFAELKQTVEGNPATVDSFLSLAHASHSMGNQSSMETYFEIAAQMASKNDDPSSKLRQVMQSQLKVNDLGGAYQTWRRVVPGDRSYIGREFLEALMKVKHYSGVMQYVEQLPSKDGKTNATFSAICFTYNGIGDDVHSWR